MQQHPFDELYGLALNLVPDPDVAGDLFMDARDEADLRRRADRWRRQNGLPAAGPGVAPRSLTPDEQDYAAHLAARRRKRQRTSRVLEWVGAAAVAVAALLLALIRLPMGLEANPAFVTEPALASREVNALAFRVYQATMTPGTVTVYWQVEGPGAGNLAKQTHPVLHPSSGGTGEIVSSDVTTVHGTTVYGCTVFRAVLDDPDNREAIFGLTGPGVEGQAGWQISLRLTPVEDPAARTVQVDRTISSERGIDVQVVSVTVAPHYTVVRYRAQGDPYDMELARDVALQAGESPLERQGAWLRDQRTQEREAVFGPVPSGEKRLTVSFPRLALRRYQTVVYPFHAAPVLKKWDRTGDSLVGYLEFEPDQNVVDVQAAVVDVEGRRYPMVARPVTVDPKSPPRVNLFAVVLPPDSEIKTLVVEGLRTDGVVPALTVEL